MADVWHCLDPDCERPLIDCGDVFACPACGARWTPVQMAAEAFAVARELAAGWSLLRNLAEPA